MCFYYPVIEFLHTDPVWLTLQTMVSVSQIGKFGVIYLYALDQGFDPDFHGPQAAGILHHDSSLSY
jgi:hypothetical protein